MAATASPPAFSEDIIIGRASVVDGDTIEIAGQRIRFGGIDAPEGNQTCHDNSGRPYLCGQKAAAELDRFLAGSRPTHCDPSGRDRYRRIIATCFRNDDQNVSEWLVRHGWALDWHRYSKGAFAAAQEAARADKRGLWRGHFIEPWAWRKGER